MAANPNPTGLVRYSVPGHEQLDDAAEIQGDELRFRVRETPDWKKHAADQQLQRLGANPVGFCNPQINDGSLAEKPLCRRYFSNPRGIIQVDTRTLLAAVCAPQTYRPAKDLHRCTPTTSILQNSSTRAWPRRERRRLRC